MELLELSEILFNVTVSVAAMIVGLAVLILADRAFKSLKAIEDFFNTLNEKSSRAYKHLSVILAGASAVPFISKLFKKRKT